MPTPPRVRASTTAASKEVKVDITIRERPLMGTGKAALHLRRVVYFRKESAGGL